MYASRIFASVHSSCVEISSSGQHLFRHLQFAVGLPWSGESNSVNIRANLDPYLNAFLECLAWTDHRPDPQPFADGAVFRSATGQKQQLSARKEIVLSAGALRSPHLFGQSAIGNAKILKKHGSEIQVDSYFLGENLQDQNTTDTAYTAKQSFTGGGGFIGYDNANDVFGNSTDPVKAEVKAAIPNYAQKINWGLMPFSRGSIHIQSAKASAPASIDPDYFMRNWDAKQQVGTAELARAVANTSPFKDLLGQETTPGLATVPANASEASWADSLKSRYRLNFHHLSTAAMMSRELGGVMDDTISGDSGHLTSTLYDLAKRAADVIQAPYATTGYISAGNAVLVITKYFVLLDKFRFRGYNVAHQPKEACDSSRYGQFSPLYGWRAYGAAESRSIVRPNISLVDCCPGQVRYGCVTFVHLPGYLKTDLTSATYDCEESVATTSEDTG
ncbi:hypothetical protein AC579_5653 [Pseudocercospora musae]|uniref:Glucose-methanol-choline oxidoreductase N-terminal domain-containing protein n=1 Tax=Pseudocercospora musae TaxID=113226 RepID=A0A139IC28_9PEZI|nr:hypothetical protein AC579_5653 [Pseudocercospora musae]